MIKKLIIVFFLFLFLAMAFLTFPMPYTLFSNSTKEKFPREESVRLNSSKIERCKERTVYASEKNGYTETGEELFDPRCSKLQIELNKAILNGNFDLTKDLLAQGANANTPNNDYDLQYPIFTAVSQKNIQLAKLLLDNGADVNHQRCCCMSCQRVLDIGVKKHDSEMVKLLLERGSDISLPPVYPDEYSTLTLVARFGDFETVQLFDEACRNDLTCRAEFRAKRVWYFLKTIFVKENIGS